MTKQADACRSILVSAFALFSRFGFCFCLVFPAKPLNAKASGSPPFFSSPRLLPQPPPLKQVSRGAQTARTAKFFLPPPFFPMNKLFLSYPLCTFLCPHKKTNLSARFYTFPLLLVFVLSSPFPQVDFFLFIPSSPWKIFPFSVPSSRREGGRQGEWAKKNVCRAMNVRQTF